MNILVTGGLGYIGSHTVVELINNNHNPFIVDDLSKTTKEVCGRIQQITGRDVPLFEFDLSRHSDELREYIINNDIEGVIHFAAYKCVGESTRRPIEYLQNNINSLTNILLAVKGSKCKKFIFSSSCTVYGEPEEIPVSEECSIKYHTSPYGLTKQIGEDILREISPTTEMDIVMLRYFNPIGNHHSGLIYDNQKEKENLIPYILDVINGDKEYLTVFGDDYDTHDGTAVRDYIDVNDLAKVHVKALNHDRKIDVFNVGSGFGYSVLDIIKEFKEIGINIPYEIVERRAGDVSKIYACTKKTTEVLGFSCDTPLSNTLQSILNIEPL